MAKIGISDAVGPVEVDLFGHEFETLPATRKLLADLSPLEQELEKTENAEDLVDVIARMIDVRVRSTNGSKRKPSTLIKERWKADELSMTQIQQLLDDLNNVQMARPT